MSLGLRLSGARIRLLPRRGRFTIGVAGPPERGERHVALPVAVGTVEKDPRTDLAAPVLRGDNGSLTDRARERRGRFDGRHSSPPYGPAPSPPRQGPFRRRGGEFLLGALPAPPSTVGGPRALSLMIDLHTHSNVSDGSDPPE